MPKPKLFQPITIGTTRLQHRVVFAPCTRHRCDADGVVLPHVKTYYGQRASVPGTLLITEATTIAPEAGGYTYIPGIWSEEQVAGWKEVRTRFRTKSQLNLA
jgi:2,4-dienoyl-CoA reductase-like NADH-dependent reductase (Old Yellow Enzyme family)